MRVSGLGRDYSARSVCQGGVGEVVGLRHDDVARIAVDEAYEGLPLSHRLYDFRPVEHVGADHLAGNQRSDALGLSCGRAFVASPRGHAGDEPAVVPDARKGGHDQLHKMGAALGDRRDDHRRPVREVERIGRSPDDGPRKALRRDTRLPIDCVDDEPCLPCRNHVLPSPA